MCLLKILPCFARVESMGEGRSEGKPIGNSHMFLQGSSHPTAWLLLWGSSGGARGMFSHRRVRKSAGIHQVGFWQTVKVFSAGCCKPLNFKGPFAKENHFPAAALIKNKDFQFIAGSKAGCHFIGLSDECASHAFLVRVSAMFSWILNNENIFLTHWTKISPATDPLLSRSPIFATVFLFPR